jgi:hypothetical protein
LEIEGYTARGMSDETMRAAAGIVAWLCRAYAIPPTWVQGGEGRGVCQHHDLGAAGGGHVDCTAVGGPDWRRFLEFVSQAHDALGAGTLPPLALHGLPNPHQVSPPETTAAEASHGGATRAEADDKFAHRTASGFPHGSTADLQWRLNRAGARPQLDIDGAFGVLTRAALRQFQASHGCAADSLLGPETWAALQAALDRAVAV